MIFGQCFTFQIYNQSDNDSIYYLFSFNNPLFFVSALTGTLKWRCQRRPPWRPMDWLNGSRLPSIIRPVKWTWSTSRSTSRLVSWSSAAGRMMASRCVKNTIVKNLLEFSRILQNLAESCRILQNLAESCRILQNLAESCRTLQNLVESCAILQNLAESCKILHK
jgi:hypothetical protein